MLVSGAYELAEFDEFLTSGSRGSTLSKAGTTAPWPACHYLIQQC